MNWSFASLDGMQRACGEDSWQPGRIFEAHSPPWLRLSKNGSLDEAAFRALVSWQIAEGTQGLVPVGTTGESPTVSHDEHKRVVEWCVDEARGRVPVIAGAGSNSTREPSNSPNTPSKPAPTRCWW